MAEELVKMKALKSFRNKQHEGLINSGQSFHTTETRARALDRAGLAARFPKPAMNDATRDESPAEGEALISENQDSVVSDHSDEAELDQSPLEQTGETQGLSSSPHPVRVLDNPASQKSGGRKGKRR